LTVNPLGNVSVIVTVPVLAAVPLLLAVIAYVPVCPCVKLPVWLLPIVQTGAPLVPPYA
jgi:hypothetical protein